MLLQSRLFSSRNQRKLARCFGELVESNARLFFLFSAPCGPPLPIAMQVFVQYFVQVLRILGADGPCDATHQDFVHVSRRTEMRPTNDDWNEKDENR